jgi:hypothetical protein
MSQNIDKVNLDPVKYLEQKVQENFNRSLALNNLLKRHTLEVSVLKSHRFQMGTALFLSVVANIVLAHHILELHFYLNR